MNIGVFSAVFDAIASIVMGDALLLEDLPLLTSTKRCGSHG